MAGCPQIVKEQPHAPRRIQKSEEEPATTSTPSGIDIEEDTLGQPRLQWCRFLHGHDARAPGYSRPTGIHNSDIFRLKTVHPPTALRKLCPSCPAEFCPHPYGQEPGLGANSQTRFSQLAARKISPRPQPRGSGCRSSSWSR